MDLRISLAAASLPFHAMKPSPSPSFAGASARPALLAVLISLFVQNIGATHAKQLFVVIGPEATSALRIGLSALVLVLLRRAWRQRPTRTKWPIVATYGLMLGAMNILIYEAFARIPIGIAIAIEILGPMAVGAFGARRALGAFWSAVALGGLLLLLPLGQAVDATLDPVGVACAAGAALAWALYILAGKQAAHLTGVDSVAWGMVVAAMLAIPLGVSADLRWVFSPAILLAGLAVAVLSSVIPYVLEMWAMRRLPAATVGALISAAPAIGAWVGWWLLDEQLTARQWVAILLIVAAAAGHGFSTGTARHRDTKAG